jgi:4-diphosphocytidyl-2-C-methyl-D-erythritol kinase
MKRVQVRAPAKVNLFLRITGKRADGYHLLDSLMVPVSLSDELEIQAQGPRSGIVVSCNDPTIPVGEANLAHRAAALLLQEAGAKAEVAINLHKVIPAGSGLGGGSSDAAAVLKGLNDLLALGLKREELSALGTRLGADVPFFISCQPARIGGVGEIVAPIERLPTLWLVVIVPLFAISTAWAYARFDELPPTEPSLAVIEPFLTGHWPLHGLLVNDLERAVLPHYPAIARLKEELLYLGAGGAAMSGSGSAVFGVFQSEEEAQRVSRAVAEAFAEAFTGQRGIFVIKTLGAST